MYITIDVGRTNTRIASFRDLKDKKIVKISRIPTLNSYENDLLNIVNSVKEITNNKIDGLGIAVAGSVDQKKGAICIAANLKDWIGKPLRKNLSTALKTKVYLENDTSCAALGEAFYSNNKSNEFIFIIWGTGIGGVHLIKNGGNISYKNFEPEFQLLSWKGRTREFAFNSVSGMGIEKKYKKKAANLNKNEWQETLRGFAQILHNISTVRLVDNIIIGGGVAIKSPQKIKELNEILQNHCRKYYPTPTVRVTKLGDNAGLLGALALIKLNMNNQKTFNL